jgi:hypothetical protein
MITREIVAPRNRKKIYVIVGLLMLGQQFQARAETVQGNLGLEQTTVVSSIYQTTPISTIQAEATYARQFAGRFSAFAQYQTNVNNTLSAGIGGVTYDTADILTKGGDIHTDGSAEVTRVPVWMFRSSLGLGLFKYVDILKSNNTSLGSNNAVPVQADLYGLKFAGTVIRFLNDDWGIVASGSYIVASAQNFGISSTCFSFGMIYRNN